MSLGRAAVFAASASVHAALAGWLAAAPGAGAPPPVVIDLLSVAAGAEPATEPAARAVPGPMRSLGPSPRAAPRSRPTPPVASRAAEPTGPAKTPEPPGATSGGEPAVAARAADPVRAAPSRPEERPEPAPPPRAATPEPTRGDPAVRPDPAPSQASGSGVEDTRASTPAAETEGGAGRAGVPGAAGAAGGDSRRAGAGGPGAAVALARPGDGAGGVPAEYAGYLARFRESVQSALRYPLSARRRGVSGSVELEVAIDPAGRVTAVKVVSSSSHEVLDEAAADAVRRLRPLPLPAHLPARPLVIRLPLVFDLR